MLRTIEARRFTLWRIYFSWFPEQHLPLTSLVQLENSISENLRLSWVIGLGSCEAFSRCFCTKIVWLPTSKIKSSKVLFEPVWLKNKVLFLPMWCSKLSRFWSTHFSD